jgi:hypothetical protein
MDHVLLDIVLERLVADSVLTDDAREAVWAACEGSAALDAWATGSAETHLPVPTTESEDDTEPLGAYVA